MFSFSLQSARRILCLGAHSDDIEIGVGGTLLELAERRSDLQIWWAVCSAPGERAAEARASATDLLSAVPNREIKIGSFSESYFPNEWPFIKDWLEEIRTQFDPEIIFTHYRNDRHQDHRVVSDQSWNTFRNHLILEYEILKYDGDLGQPNIFIPLTDKSAERKVELLMKHFQTQTKKHWFTRDTFEAMHRVRGVECAAARAEAFYGRKLVCDIR